MGKRIQSQVFIFTRLHCLHPQILFSLDCSDSSLPAQMDFTVDFYSKLRHGVSDSELALLAMDPEACDLSNELTWNRQTNVSQWFVDRRNQCRAIGFLLYDQEVPQVLGRDDSVLLAGDVVYVVNHQRYGLYRPMFKIFWFPGIGQTGYPTAQMVDEGDEEPFEHDVPSFAMVGQAGCFVNAVICIQRLFRTRRSFRTLVGAQLLPIRLRHMVIQHTVAQFLDLRPPKTAVECSV